MSATITAGKLNFTIFGYGYNDERGNSGAGLRDEISLPFESVYIEFDSTGDYCWIVASFTHTLKKYDTLTWEEVDKGELLPDKCSMLTHPKNVPNNYGIAIEADTNECYIFDLTTNEILISGETEYTIPSHCDCMLIDDEIKLLSLGQGRTNNPIQTLSLEDLSMTQAVMSNTGVIGFTDNTHIFGYYAKEWFYQKSRVYMLSDSGSPIWYIEQSNFDNISVAGLTKDGKFYIPCLINDVWVMGEFPQTPTPDLITPTPSKTFGSFESRPSMIHNNYLNVIYSTDRDLAVFCTEGVGMYMTDFENLYKLVDEDIPITPMAIRDGMLMYSNVDTGTTEVISF